MFQTGDVYALDGGKYAYLGNSAENELMFYSMSGTVAIYRTAEWAESLIPTGENIWCHTGVTDHFLTCTIWGDRSITTATTTVNGQIYPLSECPLYGDLLHYMEMISASMPKKLIFVLRSLIRGMGADIERIIHSPHGVVVDLQSTGIDLGVRVVETEHEMVLALCAGWVKIGQIGKLP